MPDSLRPHELSLFRFLCLCDSLSKNSGVDWHSLLQRIFPPQGSNPGLCRDLLKQLIISGLFNEKTLHNSWNISINNIRYVTSLIVVLLDLILVTRASLVAQMVKISPAMQAIWSPGLITLLGNLCYMSILKRNRTNSSIFMCFYISR